MKLCCVQSIFFTLFKLLPPLSAAENLPDFHFENYASQHMYCMIASHSPAQCVATEQLRFGPSSSSAQGPRLKQQNYSQRTLCSNHCRFTELLFYLLQHVFKEVKEILTFNVLQKTMFGQNGPVPVPEKSICSVVGYFRLYQLSQAVWLRTVFAVVIGDVGVIIEDLEEQQSYS